MQKQLARRFLTMYFSTLLLGLVAVTYIYAWPSPVAMQPLELPQQQELAIASEPARQSFVSYSEEGKISAFWKTPEESRYRFTIVIDPTESSDTATGDAEELPDPGEAAPDDSTEANSP